MNIDLLNPQSSALCLISGGLDSPIATYLMIQKGITPIAIFFDSQLGDPQSQRLRAKNNIQKLAHYMPEKRMRFITVPYHHAMSEFYSKGNPKYVCVHCKRYLYRTTAFIAEKHQIPVIVTGEIIGEQASQTIDNLSIIQHNTKIPVLRPLVGYDKNEILRIAHSIGTYVVSTIPANSCGFVPSKPVVDGYIDVIAEDERNFNLTDLIEKSVSEATIEWVPEKNNLQVLYST